MRLSTLYEKLLRLTDEMHTHKGKELARERHEFMLEFVRRWEKEMGVG